MVSAGEAPGVACLGGDFVTAISSHWTRLAERPRPPSLSQRHEPGRRSLEADIEWCGLHCQICCMSVRDWPKPARLAAQWALITLCFALAFFPASFLILVASNGGAEAVSWSRLLGGYSLLVTIPTTLVIGAFVALQMQKNPNRRSFGFSIAMGTTLGLIVGLVLSLITGGYSLLSAPPVGFLAFFVAWLIRYVRPPNSSAA